MDRARERGRSRRGCIWLHVPGAGGQREEGIRDVNNNEIILCLRFPFARGNLSQGILRVIVSATRGMIVEVRVGVDGLRRGRVSAGNSGKVQSRIFTSSNLAKHMGTGYNSREGNLI